MIITSLNEVKQGGKGESKMSYAEEPFDYSGYKSDLMNSLITTYIVER